MQAGGKNSLFHVQCLILFMVYAVTSATNNETPSPNVGDLKLVLWDTRENLYEVRIYYSDGTVEPKWGAICNDISSINEAQVICHQVGKVLSTPYEHSFGGRSTGTPVWLKGVACDGSELHLLRCTHSVISRGMDNQTTCGPHGERLVVKCDDEDDAKLLHYNGQVKLCPPDIMINNDSSSNTITSTSHGVVSLRLNNQWRGINQQATGGPLGGNEADALCRQMGYTHAVSGSALAKDASGYTFNKCDTSTHQPHAPQHNAWITTERINCRHDTQQKCFGCCYDYASAVFPNGCPTCNSSYDLTISCSFDPAKGILNTGTQGNAHDCALNSNNAVSTCYSEPSAHDPSVTPLALLLSAAIIVIVVLFVYIILFRGRELKCPLKHPRDVEKQKLVDKDNENKKL